MKKSLSLLTGIIFFLSFNLSAEFIEITPTDPDMGDLSHSAAYEWMVNIGAYTQGKGNVLSVTLCIEDIYNNDLSQNELFISLLDINTPKYPLNKVVGFSDNHLMIEDYFGSQSGNWTHYSYVGSYIDNDGPLTHENISFTMDLSTFNQYTSDNGWIGIGLDPDCHFYNSKIKLVVEVPEPSSLSMLILGMTLLGGFGWTRRKK